MAACADAAFQLVNACSALAALAAVNSEHTGSHLRNAVEGGGEGGKIRSFLGEPERPKVLHFASESTDKFPKVNECKTCGDACKTCAEECRKAA